MRDDPAPFARGMLNVVESVADGELFGDTTPEEGQATTARAASKFVLFR